MKRIIIFIISLILLTGCTDSKKSCAAASKMIENIGIELKLNSCSCDHGSEYNYCVLKINNVHSVWYCSGNKCKPVKLVKEDNK